MGRSIAAVVIGFVVIGVLSFGLAFSVAGTVARWNDAPAWYHILGLALVMPSAWLGGWLRERELSRGGERRGPVTA